MNISISEIQEFENDYKECKNAVIDSWTVPSGCVSEQRQSTKENGILLQKALAKPVMSFGAM